MLNINFRSDATLYRQGTPITNYFTNTNSPVERGALLRKVFSDAKPFDFIQIGPGLFDFGHIDGNVTLPNNVTIAGCGMDATVLLSSVWSDSQGTAFVLQNTNLREMSLQNDTYIKDEDGRTIGFDPLPTQTLPFVAKIERCRLIGGAWTVYNWNNLGNSLHIYDSELLFGRHGISAMGSGSSSSQFIEAYRCHFDGDAARSNDVGATSNINYGGVFGVVARGGRTRIIDCSMNLVGRAAPGISYTPRVCGVTDWFEAGPNNGTTIEILNLRSKIIPNGSVAEKCFDIDIITPSVKATLLFDGGWGSGADGAFIKS